MESEKTWRGSMKNGFLEIGNHHIKDDAEENQEQCDGKKDN